MGAADDSTRMTDDTRTVQIHQSSRLGIPRTEISATGEIARTA